jgi:hypothetical protein
MSQAGNTIEARLHLLETEVSALKDEKAIADLMMKWVR